MLITQKKHRSTKVQNLNRTDYHNRMEIFEKPNQHLKIHLSKQQTRQTTEKKDTKQPTFTIRFFPLKFRK